MKKNNNMNQLNKLILKTKNDWLNLFLESVNPLKIIN